MDITSELEASLSKFFNWNKARVHCFTQMVLAVITVRTVNMTQWATAFVSDAKQDSVYMRIRRFFRHFKLEQTDIALMLFKLFQLEGKSIYLTMDRTQWQFGKRPINILMLGVVYQGIAIPLLWSLLGPKKGGSNCQERIDLIERFTTCFGTSNIAGILGDREFIGQRWFRYLNKRKIPFYFRIKKNMVVKTHRGREVSVYRLFEKLKPYEHDILKHPVCLGGMKLSIACARCPDRDYLIIATNQSSHNAIDIYRCRWQIETLFGCLKTRGFNFEDTHLQSYERITKMVAILAVAFAWAHKVGQWHSMANPIKLKKHGRKAESIFRRGLRYLRHLIFNPRNRKLIKAFVNILFTPPDLLRQINVGVTL